jgi:hypothetical protein
MHFPERLDQKNGCVSSILCDRGASSDGYLVEYLPSAQCMHQKQSN